MVMAWAGQICRGLVGWTGWSQRGKWIGEIYSFAELAGDAALFAGGVPAEGVLATESGGDRSLH